MRPYRETRRWGLLLVDEAGKSHFYVLAAALSFREDP